MKRISILVCPQALASSVAIPLEMISAADTIHRLKNHQRQPNLELLTVARDSSSLLSMSGGLLLQPTGSLSDNTQNTMVFIPALWGNPRAAVRQLPEATAWLQQQYAGGATICSVGTGSYFLAEAGLLDHRSATTHWRYFDDFAQHYPAIKVERKKFITHQDRLYCTGSVNAVRDVMLHFVEQLFSSKVADEVARHFTHELKRSYESLLLAADPQDSHHDELIIKIQEWLQNHYESDVNMKTLAELFGLNVRSFNRRFRQAANKTPVEYLQEVRINQARGLLKSSNLSIAEIAFAVGYQDVSYFTGLFQRLHGVTPNAYRRLVRTKMFNVANPQN
ncbi:MAG: helix-turn-helix domain-containing protein [Pseudohongiella sp.]|nr:helix-turn-helix domain-containing protein [Pseudohongiella sp.]MDP2128431.1 helix-turn-helix domain-containing protein [Pseudohongiella sp.]